MRFLKTAISLALAAFAAVASAQPSTRGNAFTAPAPGVVLEGGDTFTFAWMNLVGERVTLTLMDGASGSLRPITTIATNIPNSGSYEWEVPENIPTSASYTVRISYDSNPANYNYSDRFTVTTDVVATTSAASTTSAPPTSTSASSSASSTSESSSASTSTSTSETETTSASTTVRTTSTRRSTATSESTSEPTSQGAPQNAGTTTLSSPLAVIMAVLAAALFIH